MTSRTEEEREKALAAFRARKQSTPGTVATRPPSVSPSAPRKVNSAYDSIDDVSLGKRASEVWSDNNLATIPCYDVAQVNSAVAVQLGMALLTQLTSGAVNTTTADICLSLAVSIPKPTTNTFEHMLELLPVTIGKKIPFSTPTGEQRKGLNPLQEKQLTKAKADAEATTDETKKKQFQELITRLEKAATDSSSSNSAVVSESDASSYCFVAAALLKLYGKTPAAFIDLIQSLKNRFAAWYDSPPTALDKLSVTENTLNTLKAVFSRRPEMLSTWTLWVSYNENRTDPLLSTQQGLMNYLACQQFSYVGMHAYGMIIEIHEATGAKFSTILKELDCPITRQGVKMVHDIIRDHEVTSKNPTRNTYFRYARNWNPKYFGALQSTHCQTLVYVVASVSKKLSAQGSKGDPMEIYAIKDMDPAMKNRLDPIAIRLTDMLLDHMLLDEMSGSSWFEKA